MKSRLTTNDAPNWTKRLLTAGLIASLCGTAAVAQQPPATQPFGRPGTTLATSRPMYVTAGADGLTLNFKDAPIDGVLDQLSEAAGFVVIKDVNVTGRISVTSRQPVNPQEALELLNTALRSSNLGAVQSGRILRIVKRDYASKANIPVFTGTDPDKIPVTDEKITQIMAVRYLDANQLKQDLATLITAEGDLSSNANSNTLILTDTSASVNRIARILQSLDTRIAESNEVRVFPLKHASAVSAAKLINDLFQNDGTGTSGNRNNNNNNPFGFPFGGGRFGGGGGGPGGGNFGGGGGGGGGGSGNANSTAGARAKGKVTASADERTNMVVVSGPGDTLDAIKNVLKDLDADPSSETGVFIYNLKNAQAVNLEPVLNSIFGNSGTGSRTNTQSSNPFGGFQSSFGTFGQTGGATGGRGATGGTGGFGSFGGTTGGFGTNAGGRTGTNNRTGGTNTTFGGAGRNLSSSAQNAANDLAGQVSVVANADTNALLVTANPKNFDRVRTIIDELDRPVAQVLIKVLIAEVSHDDNKDLGAEFSLLNLRASGNGVKGGTNFGIGPIINNPNSAPFAQIIEKNATASIRALETSDKTDVLSRPYVLASDNQTASIMVGQEVPIVTRSQTTDTGNQINSYNYQDVGIILQVTPHINPDGQVILDVQPEISALTSQFITVQAGVNVPVIARRMAQSRVGVQDGQTVVFGGLMEDRLTDHVDKVPILGDIPILRFAFSSTTKKKTKTELLIFLTPHVASSPKVMESMSRDELNNVKIVPKAVEKGAFEEHMKGLQRGTTQPSGPEMK